VDGSAPRTQRLLLRPLAPAGKVFDDAEDDIVDDACLGVFLNMEVTRAIAALVCAASDNSASGVAPNALGGQVQEAAAAAPAAELLPVPMWAHHVDWRDRGDGRAAGECRELRGAGGGGSSRSASSSSRGGTDACRPVEPSGSSVGDGGGTRTGRHRASSSAPAAGSAASSEPGSTCGGLGRTTVILSRISDVLDNKGVKRALDGMGFAGRFDAVHVPMKSPRNGHNLGYAFVNFVRPEDAVECIRRCGGRPFGGADTPCVAEYSHRQGAMFTSSRAQASSQKRAQQGSGDGGWGGAAGRRGGGDGWHMPQAALERSPDKERRKGRAHDARPHHRHAPWRPKQGSF